MIYYVLTFQLFSALRPFKDLWKAIEKFANESKS